MRVLLDENLPRALAAELAGHEVSTVQAAGWSGTTNGELLRRAQGSFDVLLSMDRGLQHQQNRSALRLRIVVIRAPSNRMVHLRPLVGSILNTLGIVAAWTVARGRRRLTRRHPYSRNLGYRPRPSSNTSGAQARRRRDRFGVHGVRSGLLLSFGVSRTLGVAEGDRGGTPGRPPDHNPVDERQPAPPAS